MNIFNFVKDIFNPVAKLVDNVHTSEEERLKLQVGLREVEYKIQEKMIALETKLVEGQSLIIQAEAQGKSWLQRNWRPLTAVTFLALIICDCFGLLVFRLSKEAWLLLQIMIGGYVGGRTIEKITPTIIKAVKGRK